MDDLNSSGAIIDASYYGYINIVKYLVNHKHVDVTVKNNLSLHYAQGHFELSKFLVEHGADPSRLSEDCKKYIMICQKTREKILKKLYFWWVRVCYSTDNLCGQRMMVHNYNKYKKINII